jgi:nicotinate-nucleotide pyrophosphorylase (carboxylating)
VNIEALVRAALLEDVGTGDITTEACVDPGMDGEALIRAKSKLVVCGHEPAKETFDQVRAVYKALVPDGTLVEPGTPVASITGPMRSLLTGERVALNFLMRLSGIATHTRSCVAAAGGLKVVDTRKTTPVHRLLEKHAVRMGGADNHRFALYDAVLIKENHIMASGGVVAAVQRAKVAVDGRFGVQVEVETLAQLDAAIVAGADAVLLDNMDDTTLKRAVDAAGGRVLLEASGGMTPERLPRLIGMGLDRVSMGGLIHQARWADLSMRVVGLADEAAEGLW